MHVAAFDIVCLVIVLILAVRATFRGFIDEFMSIASLFLGLGVAVLFTGKASVFVNTYVHSSFWSPVIAFLVLFLVVYIIVKLFENALNSFTEKVHLEKLDQSLGFFLGILEGGIVIVILVFVLEIQPLFHTSALFRNSIAYRIANMVIPVGKELFEKNALISG